MKDYGFVSIILPVYNAARFIAEANLSCRKIRQNRNVVFQMPQ